MRDKMIKIDANKLYHQFNERGLKFSKVCAEIGVNNSYFSNVKTRGSLSSMMAVLLESRFGIPRDTYVIKEDDDTTVVEVINNQTDLFSEENQQKLYKLIYTAMYTAMKRALNE